MAGAIKRNTYSMNTSANILQTIEAALAAVPYPTVPEGLYEPIEYVLSAGGKRLRPTLLLLAYGLYHDDITPAMPAAIGIETYHNHTLLHDDLMDKADMRRGRPTVHRKWDDNTAILSGDTMLILAFEHFLECHCPRQHELLSLFARSAREICEGQQYDMNFERRTDVSVSEYLEMIRLKTSVLLACALKAGAIAADAPQEDADMLYAFGEELGLAFQLQDDYLDVYGDPAVFGKKIGGDILCAKKTFLLINAYDRADGATRTELLATLGDKEMAAEEKIKKVTETYNRLGIAELTLKAIDDHYAVAMQALDSLNVDKEKKKPLHDYALSMLNRKK